MTKRSKKIPKNPILGPFWLLFCPNLGRNVFSWKNRFCQFSNIPIIYHHTRNQRKLITYSWEKCRTDGRTDRRTDNGDFIGPSVGRGSNKPCLRLLTIATKNHNSPLSLFLKSLAAHPLNEVCRTSISPSSSWNWNSEIQKMKREKSFSV